MQCVNVGFKTTYSLVLPVRGLLRVPDVLWEWRKGVQASRLRHFQAQVRGKGRVWVVAWLRMETYILVPYARPGLARTVPVCGYVQEACHAYLHASTVPTVRMQEVCHALS